MIRVSSSALPVPRKLGCQMDGSTTPVEIDPTISHPWSSDIAPRRKLPVPPTTRQFPEGVQSRPALK
ncbi:uncharacterized protein B0I36DRAFT_330162 [Microdochium trichocladiopsis]|uniref:Uncharacterized protein n=1 Tax=Microdochium trichocladiopsis TaxID=1682393 RepID=A0A9P8Y0G2_9PEZI|nr:uncharacterized protein B0I36DRAFT_330162 [Microdochium trichocladiopsis]KAH7026226.1 hypothetical protein B0I36DRAFT_330162 [Microdochium trichocladiopsis]